MDRDDLAFAGAAALARLVREGQVSSRELVELYLDRIGRIDPALNAYRVVMAERALADADQADARRRGGDDRPLLGVPLAVKDTEDVAGEITRWGTAAFTEPAARDGEFVSRLRSAGAVVLGKTNLPELAIIGATEGPAFGVTRNPWDLDATPGGSSGGSAAVVAAGLAAAATASDGAGSIRIPAANCGLVGLKPQRDRIPIAPPGHWHGMSALGFETRTVADTGLLLDVGAGTLAERRYAAATERAPGQLRVALSTKPILVARVDPQLRKAVEETGERLRSLGHSVTVRDPDYGYAAGNALTARYLGGVAEDVARVPRADRLQRRTRGFGRLGRMLPEGIVRRATRDAMSHAERINRIFDDFDVLVTPTTGRPPVSATEWEGMSAPRTLIGMADTYPYTAIWNHTGQPAMSVPAPSLSDRGLPLGVLLVARPDAEETLLSLGAQLEAEVGWPARRPPVS
ncbi:MAG TPA: amidase family protein [Thermoleophilaceae bacterium]|nr:amidase family protein [Thermoleophilaceae bacterium]